GADEEAAALARRQRLAEEIERAADLVGAHRRKVLALEVDMRAGAGGKVDVFLQRRFGKKRPHGFGRLRHPAREGTARLARRNVIHRHQTNRSTFSKRRTSTSPTSEMRSSGMTTS